jgi:hypothetical protein
MSRSTVGGQELIILYAHDNSRNDSDWYVEMKDSHKRKYSTTPLEIDLQKSLICIFLTHNFPDGPLKCLSQVWHLYLDLETVTGNTIALLISSMRSGPCCSCDNVGTSIENMSKFTHPVVH